ncbi:heme ABC transporter ATP-binding protein [Agreia sp. COWG]|uniref:heme ABC transporter ATP-binding protein n=1 Tax=Agreia sp. COWG TaxID=2773266 RepID=UPI0019288AC9|nr:heme ABC transporter ATP-binding protein [Agreia sp. COWG]CAD6006592.1 Hemin import ATP-binding protein HmuV [Agreia sp. COWG]
MTRHDIPAGLARGENAISARGVTVTIESTAILDGVDLDVRAGEVHALIGPNGAGKSTLLAVVAGDIRMSAGTVEIAGTNLHDWKLRDLARRRAVLLQQTGVLFPFTVQQIVAMGREPWLGTDLDRDDDEAVSWALELADVTRFANRQTPSLSGGERARTALARVLAQRTGVLLLDEPTAALDIAHQEHVLQLARRRALGGDAVLVVLHDLSLAAAYADRVTLLENGRVACAGHPDEVLTAERLSAVYDHPIDVLRHPQTGSAIVVPVRHPLL